MSKKKELFLRKIQTHRFPFFLLLFLIGSSCWNLIGCSDFTPKGSQVTTISRDINAAWDAKGKKILLIESRYKTKNPNEPYFNAASSFDWEVVLYQAKEDPQNPHNIIKGEEIYRWKEEANPGGTLQHDMVYWVSTKQRLIGMLDKRPLLLPLNRQEKSFGTLIFLHPPREEVAKIVGKERVDGVFSRNPTPSPDGKTIAIFYTLAYRPAGANFTVLHFIHFVSFFSIEDGKHLHSTRLTWPDINIDPRISPRQDFIYPQLTFLWRKDSQGVFCLDRKRAFFVPRNGDPIEKVTKVPKIPLPTQWGKISDDGRYLYLEMKGNKATIHIKKLSSWIPFQKIPMIPQGTEDYSLFISD